MTSPKHKRSPVPKQSPVNERTPAADANRRTSVQPLQLRAGAPANPLPVGMRDVLPPDAQFQSSVGRRIMNTVELFGYQRVWLPTFEYAHVLERSRNNVGETLRFVEPETGDVVALRSDMTPQVARVVATRYANAPLPVRLSYQGSVLRRRSERARLESQVVQAGAELIGMPGLEGDLEVVEVLCDAIAASGLESFALDIGHVGVVSSLLEHVPGTETRALIEALEAKSARGVQREGQRIGLDASLVRCLAGLTELHGGDELWGEAARLLGGTRAAPHVEDLRRLVRAVDGLAPEVIVDLGETRDLEYYTGTVFQLLAHGPGEPVASGGRYDRLLQRFGSPRTAAGFAIDVNHLCRSLRGGAHIPTKNTKVVCDAEASRELRAALRGAGVSCCVAAQPAEYARCWGYEHFLISSPKLALREVATAKEWPLEAADPAGQAARIAALLKN